MSELEYAIYMETADELEAIKYCMEQKRKEQKQNNKIKNDE